MAATFRWQLNSKDDFPFKRHKVRLACNTCRKRKMRCDGAMPCGRCAEQETTCKYAAATGQSRGQQGSKENVSNSDNDSRNIGTLSREDKHSRSSILRTSKTRSFTSKKRRLDRRSLHRRVSFVNSLYDTMRHQQHVNRNKPLGYLCETRLPPLLFDFFNLTSQPHAIWGRFIQCFSQFCDSKCVQSAKNLTETALALFSEHNLLYSVFVDTNALLKATSHTATFIVASSAIDTVDSLLTYAILSLVCHAAFQSLSTSHPDTAGLLRNSAASFYKDAHSHFLRITFPDGDSQPQDAATLLNLAQASILLAHYQCAAVGEEQANMTIQMGMVYLRRSANLNTAVELDSVSQVMQAWHTWLGFYLCQDVWVDGDDVGGGDLGVIPRHTEKDSRSHFQQWAVAVVDQYTRFMCDMYKDNPSFQEIKMQLVKLAELSDAMKEQENQTSVSVLSLYHHSLIIQIFLPDASTSTPSAKPPALTVPPDPHADANQDNPFGLCEEAAAKIVDTVDELTKAHHESMADYDSSHRLDPITPAVLYPLCLAASVTQSCLRRFQHSISGGWKRQYLFDTTQCNPNLATPISIVKLQRLLNPICRQMGAADVLRSYLNDIFSTSKPSTPQPQLSMEDRRLINGTPDGITASQLQRLNAKTSLGDSLSWPEVGVFDDCFFTDPFPPQGRIMMGQTGTHHPMVRNDIDREQLEKLSSNKEIRGNPMGSSISVANHGQFDGDFWGLVPTTKASSTMQTMDTSAIDPAHLGSHMTGVDALNYRYRTPGHSKSTSEMRKHKRVTANVPQMMMTMNQKRQNPVELNQRSQFGAPPTHKRVRTESISGNTPSAQAKPPNQQQNTRIHERRRPQGQSNGLALLNMSLSEHFPIYSNDQFLINWVVPGNDQSQLLSTRDRPIQPAESPITPHSPNHANLMTNIETGSNGVMVPKLPLPNSRRHTTSVMEARQENASAISMAPASFGSTLVDEMEISVISESTEGNIIPSAIPTTESVHNNHSDLTANEEIMRLMRENSSNNPVITTNNIDGQDTETHPPSSQPHQTLNHETPWINSVPSAAKLTKVNKNSSEKSTKHLTPTSHASSASSSEWATLTAVSSQIYSQPIAPLSAAQDVSGLDINDLSQSDRPSCVLDHSPWLLTQANKISTTDLSWQP